jgi:serine/threonine protein kinase
VIFLEVQLDKRIGMGEFGVLLEVSSICLRHGNSSVGDDDESSAQSTPQKPLSQTHSKSCGSLPTALIPWKDIPEENIASTLAGTYSPEQKRLRNILSRNILREIDSNSNTAAAPSNSKIVKPSLLPRYAVKQIRQDLYPKKMIEAGKDLAREAKILSRLDHPNIVGLRATVGNPGEHDFMLLLDRLGITLSEQVTDWHHRRSGGGGIGFPWKNSQRKAVERTVLSERLTALYDMSRAVQYLHQKS